MPELTDEQVQRMVIEALTKPEWTGKFLTAGGGSYEFRAKRTEDGHLHILHCEPLSEDMMRPVGSWFLDPNSKRFNADELPKEVAQMMGLGEEGA